MSEEYKCCFTGYRPQKFPFPLSRDNGDYIDFENCLTEAVFSLPRENCFTFYSGMAMGFDITAAETVLLLKQAYTAASIKLICVVPFIEQANSFSPDWKERYNNILTAADDVILISDSYYPWCYQNRNKFMVDSSDFVMTWFDGSPGGTKSTLKYAEKNGRAIINIYDYYKTLKEKK